MLAPYAKNLHPPHCRLQADDNERVDLGVLVVHRGLYEGSGLVRSQVGDSAPVFFQALNLGGPTVNPAPFDCLVEEVRKGRELAIDGPGFCGRCRWLCAIARDRPRCRCPDDD